MRGNNQLGTEGWKRLGWGSALILLVTFLVYLPVWKAGFIWDDDVLVTDNALVKAGDGLRYIWFSTRLPDYFPLTLTTFWLEWRLWGVQAAGYHITNVLLHGLAAVLVWRVLRQLKIPGGWLAALVFAVHPVNVESVAWIAERKNTLSLLFYLLAVFGYLRFEDENSTATSRRSWRWYGLGLGCFLLALLSKTGVVMLPVVLLGCAWWQRGGITRRDVQRVLPFFMLALVLGLVTMWFQAHRSIAGIAVREEGFWSRLAGAGWAVWFYLGKAVVPINLSFVYRRWEIDPAAVVTWVPGLALVGCLAVLWRYRAGWGRGPLFALGYFVVMLAPVLGFLEIYFQLYSLVADHWQYYSIIGIIAMGAGGVAKGYDKSGMIWKRVLSLAMVMMVGGLGYQTWRQTLIYQDSETLWRDTLTKNPSCWLAHGNLGVVLMQRGKAAEAIEHVEQVLWLRPNDAQAHYNWGKALILQRKYEEAIARFAEAVRIFSGCAAAHYGWGNVLELQGKFDEAVAHYAEAVKLQPDYAEAHYNWGNVLVLQGKLEEAKTHFLEALQLKPESVEAHNNLGNLLILQGKLGEAVPQFLEALKINPQYAEGHYYLASALARQKKMGEAVTHFQAALKIKPDYAAAANDLAWVLATETNAVVRNVAEAVRWASRACELTTNQVAGYLDTLGVAYSEAGRFQEAVATTEQAVSRALTSGDKTMAKRIESQLEHYRAGRAYHVILEGARP